MGIYLDYNAGTPLRPGVWDAMAAVVHAGVANASSIHWAGRAARQAIEQARTDIASLIGTTAGNVIFTSGGTEANNLAIRSVAATGQGRHIVTTEVEHVSVLETYRSLSGAGFEATYVGVDSVGRVDSAEVAAALRSDTVLVSIGLANNEVGTIQPVAEVARETGRRGIPLHVDAVQAVGKIPVDVRAIGADLMSLSAHKIGGPQGMGALFVRRDLRLAPQLSGGPQERGRRAGTENVAGAVGFGVAARMARDRLNEDTRRQRDLIARLWSGIVAVIPEAQRNSPCNDVLPNTLNVGFASVDADGLIIGLDLCGIAASAGSACAAGALEPSHVLLAMGRPPAAARAALRLSIGSDTTEADIDHFLHVLPAVIERSRRASSEVA